jgi:hypothetical protein
MRKEDSSQDKALLEERERLDEQILELREKINTADSKVRQSFTEENLDNICHASVMLYRWVNKVLHVHLREEQTQFEEDLHRFLRTSHVRSTEARRDEMRRLESGGAQFHCFSLQTAVSSWLLCIP